MLFSVKTKCCGDVGSLVGRRADVYPAVEVLSCQPSPCSAVAPPVTSTEKPALPATRQDGWFCVECSNLTRCSPTSNAQRAAVRRASVANPRLRAVGNVHQARFGQPWEGRSFSIMRPTTAPAAGSPNSPPAPPARQPPGPDPLGRLRTRHQSHAPACGIGIGVCSSHRRRVLDLLGPERHPISGKRVGRRR